MANIRVDSAVTIFDGQTLSFKSPADCSQVTGLIVYYPDSTSTVSKEFLLADAHGENVGNIDHLFAADVIVKVVLDVDEAKAFVQNADTNAYLEGRLARTYVPHTMLASGWVGNSYSFQDLYPHESYDIEIFVASTATSEQFEAFGGAMIGGDYQSNIAVAVGDVPTIDVPIIIKVVKK